MIFSGTGWFIMQQIVWFPLIGNIINLYILLTVHHVMILGKWPTWHTNSFLCIYFIYNSLHVSSTSCSKHVESCNWNKYIERNLCITLVIYQESFNLFTLWGSHCTKIGKSKKTFWNWNTYCSENVWQKTICHWIKFWFTSVLSVLSICDTVT